MTQSSNVSVSQGADGQITLKGLLTFESVPRVWQETQSLLSQSSQALLQLDLGGVSRSDSAGIAFLIECLRFSRQLGKKINYKHVPEQMLAIVRVCDLEHILFS